MVAAIAFLAAYAVPIIWPGVPHSLEVVCEVTTWSVWVCFVIDYGVRPALAEDRTAWFRSHLLDVAVIALPLLRPLRLLRLVTMLRFLDSRATMKLRGRMMSYVLGGSPLLGFVGALAVLEAERHDPHANITAFGDAMWWAVTTMTTVGYGDYFPVTGTGRLAAVGLMIGGIAILGTVTATLASWMVERIREEQHIEF
ncbi:MAG: potassium channel family protein [Arachnia sp.]